MGPLLVKIANLVLERAFKQGQESIKEALPRFLDEARAAHQAGDKSALIETLYVCTLMKMPAPEWAIDAFARGYSGIDTGRINGWSEVFGTPSDSVPTRKSNTRRQRLESEILDVLATLRTRDGLSLTEAPAQVAEGSVTRGARERSRIGQRCQGLIVQ